MFKKLKIAFVCVHNSARSQMAEALCHIHEKDFFSAQSAGTHPKEALDTKAIKVIKELYNYDMKKSHTPKSIDQLKNADIVITMGCEPSCSFLNARYEEAWDLKEPHGKAEKSYIKLSNTLLSHIKQLRKRIEDGEITLK